MKKLKTKVFLTIFLILSIVLIIFCTTNIITIYSDQKDRIVSSFNQMNNINNADKKNESIDEPNNTNMEIEKTPSETNDNNVNVPEKPDGDLFEENNNSENTIPNKVFIDLDVYTAILDESGSVQDIISHDIDSTDTSNIKAIANEIIASEKSGNHIGNLFFSKYAYSYTKNNIVIVDTSSIKTTLINRFIKIMFIFLISEIGILIITYILTKWITNPVKENFDKQKRFIADSSHELKTPLTVIAASCEAYFNDKDDKWIKNIQDETEQMSKLVIDLLDLASLEGKKTYEIKQFDLSNIIEGTVLTFESIFYDKKIVLDYEIQDNIKLEGNEILIKQLSGILIDNAIKHTDPKHKVKIKLSIKDNQINFIVSNQGLPIKKGDEEKIFERFYRADESRNRDSKRYGLGLSIAKEIVLLHKGNIVAESNGGYTNFIVTFKIK